MHFLGFRWGILDVLATCGLMLILAFLWYSIVPLMFWRRRRIPSVFSVPIFGSLVKAVFLVKSLGQIMTDIYFRYDGKRYVGYYKFAQPAVLLRDPDIIKNVLTRDFVHFSANDIQENTNDILSSRHLFVISGERWKRLRTALSPGFSSGRMKSVFPLVGEVCGNLRTYLTESIDSSEDAGYAVDMKDISARFTTDVVASVAFGLRCNSIMDPNVEFRKMGKKFMQPSAINAFLFLILFQLPWLNKILGISFVPKDITNFFRNVVLSVVTKREENGAQRNDFMQVLMQLWKEGKLRVNRLPEEESESKSDVRQVSAETLRNDQNELDDLTAQALGFFTDGFETSSVLISFVLFELAHNPNIQEKLREEIENKKALHDGTLSYEALQDMTYMDLVIQEGLRKYPPGLMMFRICTKRYYLPNPEGEGVDGGFWVEEGTPVTIPLYALQNDPQYFPDPEKFDPERFSSENKRERQQFVYMPFGEGPRMCIGSRFALLQTKLALATIVSRFQLLPNEKSKIPITINPHHFIMDSKYGLWVYLKHLK